MNDPIPEFQDLPDNITAFRADAANTNEKPVYIGKLMLFSDQDLTALKHNLVYTGVVSTVFVGLIGTISNPHIPLVWRALLLGAVLTGLHSGCIAIWNLTQSFWQVRPEYSPGALVRFVTRSWLRITLSLTGCGIATYTWGPDIVESFASSLHLMGLF